jgi:hypothetical protein
MSFCWTALRRRLESRSTQWCREQERQDRIVTLSTSEFLLRIPSEPQVGSDARERVASGKEINSYGLDQAREQRSAARNVADDYVLVFGVRSGAVDT